MNVIPQNMHWIGLREVFHTNLHSIWWGEHGRTMVSGSDVPFHQSIYPSPYGRLPHAHVKDFQKPSLVQIIDLDQVWCWETLPSKDEDLEDSTMWAVENVFFSKFKRGCFVISLRSTDPLNIIELSGLAPFSYTGFRDVIQNRDADRLWICMSSILDQILLSAIYGLIHSDIDMPTCAH